MMKGFVNNTTALLFILGYQGGTVQQLADELNVTSSSILNADEEAMGTLMRMAQKIRNEKS